VCRTAFAAELPTFLLFSSFATILSFKQYSHVLLLVSLRYLVRRGRRLLRLLAISSLSPAKAMHGDPSPTEPPAPPTVELELVASNALNEQDNSVISVPGEPDEPAVTAPTKLAGDTPAESTPSSTVPLTE
jgi:hypothetical protein